MEDYQKILDVSQLMQSQCTYTNIDTKHALEVLRLFLVDLEREGKVPPNFNI